MDFKKFWQQVEKHPWLLRVILWDIAEGRWKVEENPSLLGTMLSPSVIREQIHYIAFRPWNTLDPQSRNVRETGEGTEGSITYHLFWSKFGQPSFTGRTTLKSHQTLIKLVQQFQFNVTIDCIVRESSVARVVKNPIITQGIKNKLLGELLGSIFGNQEFMRCWDLFLPRHK